MAVILPLKVNSIIAAISPFNEKKHIQEKNNTLYRGHDVEWSCKVSHILLIQKYVSCLWRVSAQTAILLDTYPTASGHKRMQLPGGPFY